MRQLDLFAGLGGFIPPSFLKHTRGIMLKELSGQGVYAITCLANGKKYVGSAKDIKRRHYLHLWRLRSGIHENPKLQRAWEKYGESNFTFEILELVKEIERLLDVEQHWIDFLDACNKGFNICPVAGNSLGRKLSVETKQKISQANKGRIPSLETRKKLSLANKGKTLTADQRAKVSLATKGKKRSKEVCLQMSLRRKGLVQPHKYKPVVRMDTGEVYPSLNDAALAVGVTNSSISQSIKTGCQCKGIYWKFHGEEPVASKPPQRKPVKRFDTNQIFDSIKDAGMKCFISPEAISSAIKRGGKCCGTYWGYVNE
jgi:group I intron endonuclease